MPFGIALEIVKHNGYVSREAWDNPAVMLCLDTRYPDRICLCIDGDIRIYSYDNEDVFADDWFIVH